jgi:flagellar protein FliS
MKNQTEISYRIAAVDSASPIGLLLALYDTLSGNLARAAAALRAQDIERRCSELNHAYTVLGHLESWLNKDLNDPLANSLTLFYGYLRARMLEASLKQSASMLDEAVELVLNVRSTWQQREAFLHTEREASTLFPSSLPPDARIERESLSHTA